MSLPFFDAILKELRYKLNYDAIVNYAGNGYVSDAWDMISKADPFRVEDSLGQGSGMDGLSKFFSSSNIEIKKVSKGD